MFDLTSKYLVLLPQASARWQPHQILPAPLRACCFPLYLLLLSFEQQPPSCPCPCSVAASLNTSSVLSWTTTPLLLLFYSPLSLRAHSEPLLPQSHCSLETMSAGGSAFVVSVPLPAPPEVACAAMVLVRPTFRKWRLCCPSWRSCGCTIV